MVTTVTDSSEVVQDDSAISSLRRSAVKFKDRARVLTLEVPPRRWPKRPCRLGRRLKSRFASSRHTHFSPKGLRKLTETFGGNQVKRVTERFSKCQRMSMRRVQRRTEPSAAVAKAEEK